MVKVKEGQKTRLALAKRVINGGPVVALNAVMFAVFGNRYLKIGKPEAYKQTVYGVSSLLNVSETFLRLLQFLRIFTDSVVDVLDLLLSPSIFLRLLASFCCRVPIRFLAVMAAQSHMSATASPF